MSSRDMNSTAVMTVFVESFDNSPSQIFFHFFPPVPCEVDGCNAPYNLGCENMHGEAVCICPECDDILDVVCSSDDVQDRSKCMVKRQSCLVGKEIDIVQERPCGRSSVSFRRFSGDVVQEGRGPLGLFFHQEFQTFQSCFTA